MTPILTGTAIGLAAITGCYGIAWAIGKLTSQPSQDDAMQGEVGDWPYRPQVFPEHGDDR